MAVLKHTSPSASPAAPTPIPCSTVPSARARTPVAPGMIFAVMGASPSPESGGSVSYSRKGGGALWFASRPSGGRGLIRKLAPPGQGDASARAKPLNSAGFVKVAKFSQVLGRSVRAVNGWASENYRIVGLDSRLLRRYVRRTA